MKEEKKPRHRRRNFLIVFYVAVVVALSVVIYVLPKVSDAFTPTVILEYGQMQVTDEVTCYVVRDEQVVKAGRSGSTTYYVEEGAKSRKGARIMDIDGSGYYCPATGVISYYCDGLEEDYTPENMENLELIPLSEKAEEQASQPENVNRDSVSSGEPIYKVVRKDIWYGVCRVESASVVKYQQGASVSIVLPLDTIRGTVEKVLDKGDYWMVILKFNRYYEDMPKLRKLSATVITSDSSGLIAPNESLTQEDGVTGVYVKDINGNYDFTRVKVITTDGEYSLLESSAFNEKQEDGTVVRVPTVDIYDEIQRNPPSKQKAEPSQSEETDGTGETDGEGNAQDQSSQEGS